MRGLINLCFKIDGKQFIVLTKFGAACNVDENKFQTPFDKASQKLAINFLCDICFLNCGNFFYWQNVEIFMDFSQHLLFLYYYDSKWHSGTKKRDAGKKA